MIALNSAIIIPRRKRVKPLRIGAVIQSRMTSKRLPGKMLMLLGGKTLLEHVLERVKLIKGISEVILAVPDDDHSEPMLIIAERLNIENFCGSETDVLDRYYQAASYFKLDIILRLTGDCPFLDPIVCREVLDLLLWRKLDYASNVHPSRTYPQGLDCEAFTYDCLDAAHQIAHSPYEREHVTPWMQQTDGIKRGCVTQRLDQSHKNWSVDTQEDLDRLQTMLDDKQARLNENN